MTRFPSLPLWTDAWTAGTRHLTDAQRGILLSLLILMWEAPRCRIPNDDEWLARRLGKSVARLKKEVRPIIAEFCNSSGNWITQKRLLKEWRYVQQKVVSARASAKSRWSKQKEASERNANAHADAMLPTPTPTPEPKPKEKGEALSRSLEGNSLRNPDERKLAAYYQPAGPTLMSKDWRPSQADRAFARSRGWNNERIDQVAQKFLIHHQGRLPASEISRKWQLWVMNEKHEPEPVQSRATIQP